MPNNNKTLQNAAKARKDEFYTALDDIEEELKHYRKHFRDKTVFCNCDDPYESNFFKYFVLHFNQLHLKKLICTCYSGSPIMGEQISLFDIDQGDVRTPYKAEVTKVYDITGDGAISMDDIKELFLQGENKLTKLKGNGDFRSDECVEILKEADIVVTNPPFSLFREYVAQLIKYEKQFLIIGNVNAVTYKEIFPLFMDNKMWIGYRFNRRVAGKNMTFRVPDDYPLSGTEVFEKDGKKYVSVAGTGWFTNMDIKKYHEEMILFRKYDPETYPKYDNYDAINVDVTADIPCDYDGVMGVPITFLDKYCPEQFEIFDANDYRVGVNGKKPTTDTAGVAHHITCQGKNVYRRILIRNKHPEQPGGEEK